MVHAGVLLSARGVGGGFALARPAAEIHVAQIVTALEGPIAITECLGEDPETCGLEATCRVRGNWDRINHAVREALEGVTLADMAAPKPEWASGATRAHTPTAVAPAALSSASHGAPPAGTPFPGRPGAP